MSDPTQDRTQTLAHLFALADRLEGYGQINLAKLMRASADSLVRRAAFQLRLPNDSVGLAADIDRLLPMLADLGLSDGLAQAIARGTAATAAGRLPLINEIPDPYICRTCGEASLIKPQAQCPVCGAWPTSFQHFFPVYWLNELEPPAALAQLRQTPETVAALLDGLDEARLNLPAHDGGWSMRQVVSHLLDAEGVLLSRLNLMVANDNPVLESLAVFAWAADEANRPPTTAELFETYRESRRESLAILEALPPDGWWRSGQHQEFGEVTVLQQASYFSAHEQTHLASLVSLRG